jgi:hypothetical protein
MNIPHPLSIPVLPGKKPGFCKQWDQAPEEFGIEMKVIGNEMTDNMKEILTGLNIFLATVLTKFTQDLGAAIQTVGFLTILFMAHGFSAV